MDNSKPDNDSKKRYIQTCFQVCSKNGHNGYETLSQLTLYVLFDLVLRHKGTQPDRALSHNGYRHLTVKSVFHQL